MPLRLESLGTVIFAQSAPLGTKGGRASWPRPARGRWSQTCAWLLVPAPSRIDSRVAGPRGTRVVCRRAPSPPRAPTRRALGLLKLVVRPPGCGSPAPAILGLLSDRRRR